MIYENIEMSGSLDVTGSFIVPFGTSSVTASYEKGRMMFEKDSGLLYVWTGSWEVIGTQENPQSAPNTVFNDAVGNLTASISSGTNLVTMSLSEVDNITSTPFSASISGSSFEIIWSNADSSSGFIRNTSTLTEGTYYYNVTVFDSGSLNSQSYNNQTVTVAASPSYNIEYLVVAGGGGGGGESIGGGGGAGGYLTSTLNSISQGVSITVTVGSGGTGGSTVPGNGTQGGNSSLAGSGFTTVTAIGGGGGAGGGQAGTQAGSGGSGGGGAYANATTGGSGTSGQGNAGGNGNFGAAQAGGGGGAGQTGNTNGASRGGDGLQSSITGTATYYAGGGGGSLPFSTLGGQGGGGTSSTGGGQSSSPGTDGLGGGGGGGYYGGNGGSGVVILRIPTANYSSTTSGSPTVTTDGSYKVVKFTSSGTYTS